MQKIFPYLTYAGAIPFVFCAFCLSIDIQQLPLFSSIEIILSAYAWYCLFYGRCALGTTFAC